MWTWKKIFPLNVCCRSDPDWGNQVRNLSPPNTYPPTESMVGKPSDGLVAPRVGHLESMSPDNILVQTEVQLILRKNDMFI